MTWESSGPSSRSDSSATPIHSFTPSLTSPVPNAATSTSTTAPGPLVQAISQGTTSPSSADAVRHAQQLVQEWTPEISRYGLTSATLLRDPSIAGRIPPATTASPLQQPPPPLLPPKRRTSLHKLPNGLAPGQVQYSIGKRRPSRGASGLASPITGPLPKKPRLTAPGELDFRELIPSPPQIALPGAGLISPLFFSNTARHMKALPPSFPPPEAASSIMGRIPDERAEAAVTTVSLPRGKVHASSPGRSSGTPTSWSSMMERPRGLSQSPESRASPAVLQLLQGVGVIELLEQDERPTFIIDLANPTNFNPGPLQFVFMNASLRASQGLSELLSADPNDPEATTEFSRFKTWLLSFVRNNESMDVCLPSLSYGGISWTCSTLRRRFRFVSGAVSAVSITPTSPTPLAVPSSVLDQRARGPTPTRELPTTTKPRPSSDVDYFGDIVRSNGGGDDAGVGRRRANSEPGERFAEVHMETASLSADGGGTGTVMSKPSYDWTRIPLDTPGLPAHIRFARSVDWAATPLGPIEQWPSDLRIMSNMIMGSPHPAAMYWGPEFIAIYNEAYITLAGQKHPAFMGSPYSVGWAEIWDTIEPLFNNAWTAGQAIMKHEDRMYINRDGLEEVFFNWSIVPMVGGDGTVVALYNPCFENTRRKVNERRMLALRELGEQTSQARDVRGFWSLVLKGLEYNEYDVPFALVYSVGEEPEDMSTDATSNPPKIVLEGSLGAPPGHPAAAPLLDLRVSDQGFAPYMREALSKHDAPVILREEDGTLPAHLIDGLQWRGFGDPCRTVVVFPVHPTTAGAAVVGFIVMGANPRRPYDDDFQLFVHLLSRQLATSLASVVLFEEEIERGQRAARLAALDRQELSLQLRLRTQEAVESEYKFSQMAEFTPVGMFIANDEGVINYCNDMWWQVSGHPRGGGDDPHAVDSWMTSVREEDRPGVQAVWDTLVRGKLPVTHEFRFKSSRQVEGQPHDTWVLLAAYPEKTEAGALKRIFGCITDISQQKWAEDFQNKRREEAVEMKRQTENFIDITSHEMRNPLSAVLQCADEISTSIARFRVDDPSSYEPGKLNVLLDSCLEAANTIGLCASHQKRIVDDILTLSKLDSQLLLVTPVDRQPIAVIKNVLKMFETELNSNDIRGEFRVEKSYRRLAIDWVRLDPSRLQQVLINLMTNAIKFTRPQGSRAIIVSLGASRDVSEVDGDGVSYFPVGGEPVDPTNDPEWGEGERINLHLAVTDNGSGLTPSEKALLFQRFSQASPRTHVQYGGSGLGLFICRILTELQGGQIGVTSTEGVGSTFSFFIRARRSPRPNDDATPRPTSASSQAASTPTSGELTTTTQCKSSSSSSRPNAAPGSPSPPSAFARLQQQQQQSPSSSRALGAGYPSRDLQAPGPFDVLIVEDNIVNQKVLQRQLRISGNKTHVANHGGEALEALRRSRYWKQQQHHTDGVTGNGGDDIDMDDADSGAAADAEAGDDIIDISVILMDLEMPVMDGITCARRIRQLEAEGTLVQHIPIIAVTAYARPEQIANAKAAGIDDVISKPFRIPELLPKIEELVTKYGTLAVKG